MDLTAYRAMLMKGLEHSRRAKTLRIMRLTAIILFAACLHVSAGGFSQTITLSVKNVPIEQVFDQVKKQTGLSFLWDEELLKQTHPVSIEVKDATIQQVMDACMKEQPLTYNIVQNLVIIKAKRSQTTVQPGDTTHTPRSIIAACGRVMNEAGQPLPGTNITIKATGRGTITNAKGEFKLSAVPENSLLVISYIGYAPQQIRATEGTILQIFLKVAKDELDQVVVQAYGTTTQRLATGSIATVTAAQIERHPVMNPLEALQGQVPGLVIQQTSGYASAPFKAEIRGRSVINPNFPTEPLYIIDGVPLTTLNSPDGGGNYASGSTGVTENGFYGPAIGQSPLFSLNPTDIESMTVLKDADATAIYGSRGANGVIIITTKKGRPGKTKMSINIYHGESRITQHKTFLNTTQYLAMRREAFKNDGITPDNSNAYDLLNWDTTRNTDWQKYFLGGVGKTTDIQTSLDGGDKLTTFHISGSYHRQTSILNYSGADQRGSVQFNLTHKSLNQRLKLSFTSYYSFSQSDLIQFPPSLLLAPNAPSILDSHGNLNFADWLPSRDVVNWGTIFDPYTSKTGFLNSTVSFEYEILKGLKLSGQLGYSTTHQSQIQVTPMISLDPLTNPTGTSQFGNNNNSNTIIEPNLEYNTFLGQGKLSLLAGGSLQSVIQDGNVITGFGYVNDHLLKSVSNAASSRSVDNYGQYKYAAIFGRITYNWLGKYVLNLSARRDGSSVFGPGKQFGNFGAVGAAWIFSEEPLFKNHVQFLSFGKIRSSYGLTGSDQTPAYQYQANWTGTTMQPYRAGIPVYTPLNIANPELHWQTNRKLEVALDLGFLKDRISLEVAWYRNRCGDQLLVYPLPVTTGIGGIQENLPATIQNTGIEGTLHAKLIQSKDFDWGVTFNIGANHNKLVAYPGLDQSSYATIYTVGKPLNLIRLLHYTGVDPLTGSYTFLDRNKDGYLDYRNNKSADIFLHDLSVRPDGSFSTDISYRSFRLDAFFTFRKQLVTSPDFGIPGIVARNQSIDALDRWQKPGDIAHFAKFTTRGDITYSYFPNSDGMYTNGSYVRLRNLSISYSLESAWAKRLGVDGSSIYIRAENLFLITKYRGLDPDIPGLGSLPPSKTLTLGLQVHF